MPDTEVAVPETAQVKTETEFEEEFGNLHALEIKRQGKLNETVFAMGDLLNRWQPNDKTMRKLAKQFGYTVATLQQRMYAAREIPAHIRNPQLSFSAHVAVLDVKIPDDNRPDQPERAEAAEAARYELITTADALTTANKMRVLVRNKRVELGQIAVVDRRYGNGRQRGQGVSATADLQERMAKLGRAGGFVISDQHSIVKCSAGFEEDGDITITIENTSDYLPEFGPAISPVNGRPRKFTVTYTLADGANDEEAAANEDDDDDDDTEAS